MVTFAAETFHNRFLPVGGTTVDAVVTVTAAGETGAIRERPAAAEVLIIDTSGSMDYPRAKLVAAKKATEAAIDCIADGVLFGVIAGRDQGYAVFPETGYLVGASEPSRRKAKGAVKALTAGGGTAFGRWLTVARSLFQGSPPGSIRHALLLTDGRNESETPEQLAASLAICQGQFQCDCRGIGTDWEVDELRRIASTLLGTVDIIPQPETMAADFTATMQKAMAKETADVALRVWVPAGASVGFIKQVSPEIADLTERGVAVNERATDYPVGAWGTEARDYHVSIRVPPQAVGEEMLAARVSLVVDGETASQTLLDVIWTEDEALSTRICREVAEYTGQAELADAIEAGLDARVRGDDDEATERLGRAVQLAHQLGNDEQLSLLGQIVELEDPPTGTVRLRQHVSDEDELTARTRSTKTVRVEHGQR